MKEETQTGLIKILPESTTDLIQTLDPAEMIKQAANQATQLANVIEAKTLYNVISGRKYVRVEGWVPLARMNGVIPKEIENTPYPDGHYVAKVALIRVNDGMILTEASSECGGPDEPMWQKRAPYARRSMAATRATGKACRLAYSWIMALAGYEACPLEEMPPDAEALPPVYPEEKAVKKSHYENHIAPDMWEVMGDGKWVRVCPGKVLTTKWLTDHGFEPAKKPEYQGQYFIAFHSSVVDALKDKCK